MPVELCQRFSESAGGGAIRYSIGTSFRVWLASPRRCLSSVYIRKYVWGTNKNRQSRYQFGIDFVSLWSYYFKIFLLSSYRCPINVWWLSYDFPRVSGCCPVGCPMVFLFLSQCVLMFFSELPASLMFANLRSVLHVVSELWHNKDKWKDTPMPSQD